MTDMYMSIYRLYGLIGVGPEFGVWTETGHDAAGQPSAALRPPACQPTGGWSGQGAHRGLG